MTIVNGLKGVDFYFTSKIVPQETSLNCEILETSIENIQAELCLSQDYIPYTQDETLNPFIL